MSEDRTINLENLLDEEIVAHLKGGRRIEGTLMKYDSYMNLVMKKAKEYRNEDLINEHDLVVVKGGNVQMITR